MSIEPGLTPAPPQFSLTKLRGRYHGPRFCGFSLEGLFYGADIAAFETDDLCVEARLSRVG
jgi:hypothetical protein